MRHASGRSPEVRPTGFGNSATSRCRAPARTAPESCRPDDVTRSSMPSRPRPRMCRRIEALAVVLHVKDDAPRFLAHPYADGARRRGGRNCATPPGLRDRCRSCSLRAISSATLSASTVTPMPVRLEISRACHWRAGTRPKSSSMEGRSSSAMLRTTLTLLSASRGWIPVRCNSAQSGGATAPRLPSSISSALNDWPTSSCNSREMARRSCSCASTRRAESSLSSVWACTTCS